MRSSCATTALRSTGRGSAGDPRPKASSWRFSAGRRARPRGAPGRAGRRPGARGEQAPGELDLAGDHEEEVVEVVHDPARQAAEGLQPLGVRRRGRPSVGPTRAPTRAAGLAQLERGRATTRASWPGLRTRRTRQTSARHSVATGSAGRRAARGSPAVAAVVLQPRDHGDRRRPPAAGDRPRRGRPATARRTAPRTLHRARWMRPRPWRPSRWWTTPATTIVGAVSADEPHGVDRASAAPGRALGSRRGARPRDAVRSTGRLAHRAGLGRWASGRAAGSRFRPRTWRPRAARPRLAARASRRS